MSAVTNMVGRTFVRWTVVERTGSRWGNALYLCRCACGGEKVVTGNNLRNGHSKSCGCLQRELTVARFTKHGHARADAGRPSRTYSSWVGMLDRCTNENKAKFSAYGGRGIEVCDRWRESFENFLADMGERPEGMSLDRTDVDGNYEPSNCRWATPTEQAQNRRPRLRRDQLLAAASPADRAAVNRAFDAAAVSV